MNARETTASKIVTNYYYSFQCTYFNQIDWSLSHAFFIVKILHSKFDWQLTFLVYRLFYKSKINQSVCIHHWIESNRNSNTSKIGTKFCKLFFEWNCFRSYFTLYITILWCEYQTTDCNFFLNIYTNFNANLILYILHSYHVWYSLLSLIIAHICGARLKFIFIYLFIYLWMNELYAWLYDKIFQILHRISDLE